MTCVGAVSFHVSYGLSGTRYEKRRACGKLATWVYRVTEHFPTDYPFPRPRPRVIERHFCTECKVLGRDVVLRLFDPIGSAAWEKLPDDPPGDVGRIRSPDPVARRTP
jgi:hypothetical protein